MLDRLSVVLGRRLGGVVLAGLCLGALSTSVPAAAATTTPAQAPQYLFSIPTAAGSLIGPTDKHLTLRLVGTRDYLTRFTDRPLREAFVVANVDFARRFTSYFGTSEPNAVLTYTPSGSKIPVSIVLTIGHPRWNAKSSTWTLSATRIRKQPDNLPGTTVHIKPPLIPNPRSFTQGTLLIDDTSQVVDGCTIFPRPHSSQYSTHCSSMNLEGADFSGLNLNYSTLGNSNLSFANLSNSDFFHAGLVNANLTGANLSSSGFAAAYFTAANLRNANLTGATLTSADFTSANLTGATGANTSGAYLCNTTMPDGSISNRGCPYTPPGG
jgi:hypothetical protein